MTGVIQIVMGMKPLEGNFVTNAIKHGVGGLNIDGNRISGAKGKGVWGTSNATINPDRKFNASPEMTEYRSEQHNSGRWPSNVVLGHNEGCKRVGMKKVKSDGHHSYKLPEGGGLYELGLKNMDDKGNPYAGEDGKETVEAWECVEGCSIRGIDKQSGIRATGSWCRQKDGAHPFGNAKGSEYAKWKDVKESEGGASRYYKQVSEYEEA